MFKTCYILLGRACNMQCIHCSQTPLKNIPNINEVSDDCIQYLIKFCNEAYNKKIFFWGGEPLLYWKLIKDIILKLETAGIPDTTQFQITTNGLLLTDDIVDYCNKHNITIALSYDGINPLVVRQKLPSGDNIKSFMKCNKKHVICVINALNPNFVDNIEFLRNKFPKSYIFMRLLFLTTDKVPKEIYSFKDSDIEKSVKDLYFYLLKNKNNKYLRDSIRLFNYFIDGYKIPKEYINEYYNAFPYPYCKSGKFTITIDLKGNVFSCHNSNIIVDNINSDIDKIQQSYINNFINTLPIGCKDCDVFQSCRGACNTRLLNDSKTEYKECIYRRKFLKNLKKYTRIDTNLIF